MEMSPKQIVAELDKYIIGQDEAKKMVAIALRNRYRRSMLPKELRDEITPKNIIMKGPTGVGKTEIARRLSKIVNAPFVKVEATKFTEVGYVGRDVESMIRDLVEASIHLVKKEKCEAIKEQSEAKVNQKLIELVYNNIKPAEGQVINKANVEADFLAGKYENTNVEIECTDQPKQINFFGGAGGMDINIGDIMGSIMTPPGKKKKKKVMVKEAREILIQEESDKLLDMDDVYSEALSRAEQNGIIFIDEIDKITGKGGHSSNGPDVSREGVQRDILPIVEGCTVSTKYGPIKTDYILFIAAGAFHVASVEDLIPELQGRFPVLVELDSLKASDFEKILTNTENSLIKQYKELLAVDNIDLNFSEGAIKKISSLAEMENQTNENIGARRLHNILEKLLEDISFNASGDHPVIKVDIDEEYVNKNLKDNDYSLDLRRHIL